MEMSRYHDRGDAFDFTRVEADVRQYLSAFAERRVLALRLFASTSDADAGSRVPFYLMRSLGGHDSLRGFRDYRFRGPHAILTQVEYRYEIWSGFDAALLYDAGKVTDRRADLNFMRLEQDYGIGFRVNTDNGVILRVDAGFGSRDGKHLFIVFGDVF
jgi:outer membrane translocation and assembly module TamA